MPDRNLPNKPLLEAILEVRWKLTKSDNGLMTDPSYSILLGRLFDRVSGDFPYHESLPSASLPEEMAGHIVQHRFRVAPKAWPLIQVGPGILTLNSTADYSWADFKPRAVQAIKKLFNAYPNSESLSIQDITLKYIDGIDYESHEQSIIDFLSDEMKIAVRFPESLFDGETVAKKPVSFSLNSTFMATSPKGAIDVRFSTGKRADKDALIWESTFRSVRSDVPQMPDGFETWVDGAHELVNDWFFKLIEGKLRERFEKAHG